MTDALAACEALIVTGAAGFVGRHLLRHLANAPTRPRRIVAIDLHPGEVPAGGVEWLPCDLTDDRQVRATWRAVRPDGVIHLAGVTGGDLGAIFRVNVAACGHLLAASASLEAPPRVLVVGSAAQYGLTRGGPEVVDESRPLLATAPYGVSKTLQETWALQYARAGLPVVCARPFNIMGPGQPARLVPAAFLAQLADVLDGRAGEVCVGNTASRRDFTDVRDVAAALWALMCAGADADGQVVNIASGAATGIDEMLAACIALAETPVPVRQDPARLKAVDVPIVVGDATRLRELTGWRPRIDWRQSLAETWQQMRPGA